MNNRGNVSREEEFSLESDTHSLQSNTLSFKKGPSKRFVWKNTWQYLIMTLAFTTSSYSTWSFIDITGLNKETNPNIYQYIVAYITVGMPMTYMQIILGQYTQLGLLYLKYMCPIGHGMGYVCLEIITLYIVIVIINMGDFLMYFLTTLQANVQWMICPSQLGDTCWGLVTTCFSTCVSDTIHLSAYWYWNMTYLGNITDISMKSMDLEMPSLPRMISIGFSTTLTFFLVAFTSSAAIRKLVIYLFYAMMIMVFGFLLNLSTTEGGSKALQEMFGVGTGSCFLNLSAWSTAVATVVKNLCLGRACHLVYGSYMTSASYSGIMTVVSVIGNMLVHMLLTMMTYLSVASIVNDAKIEWRDYNKILFNSNSNLNLIVQPQSIGMKSVPQFWNLLYFGGMFCLLLGNNILLLNIFEKSICDLHTNLLRYRKYIVSALCFVSALSAMFLISNGLFTIYTMINKSLLVYLELVVMLFMSVIVFWIYGVKRLCDDIHFISGHQPTKYWKIFWFIIPVILGASAATVNQYIDTDDLHITSLLMFIGLLSPIPILACIEGFRYLKQRNLVGLFQPEDCWGPPDPDERHLRQVFNPRREIKSRRRNETCQHKCLLGSKVLKKIIIEEYKARSEQQYFVEAEKISMGSIGVL